MTQKKATPPPSKRSFGNIWGELDYLCKKIEFWLNKEHNRARAERYLERLEGILDKLPENDLAIIRAEGHALRCELQRNIAEAIEHRKREIQLIERLHREAKLPRYDASTRAYLLQGHDSVVLQKRRAHLAALIKAHAAQPKNLMQTSA